RAVRGGEPAEGPERDGVVAPEHDRDVAFVGGRRDSARDSLAGVLDLGEKARLRIAGPSRFRDHRLDVPPVRALEPEPGEAVVQAGVANRGRAHVDTAAARAEVEGSPDDSELSFLHGGEGYSVRVIRSREGGP